MLGTDVEDDARKILVDEGATLIWDDPKILSFINAAQRLICTFVPNANVISAALQLTANEARQTLPTGTLRLVEMPRNMGADGITPGAPIRPVSRSELEAYDRDWTQSTPASVIRHYVYDEEVPTEAWVWPRPSTAIYVDTRTNRSPVELTTLGGTLVINDIYRTPAAYLAIHAGLSTYHEDAVSLAASEKFFAAAMTMLGVKNVNDAKAAR